MNFPGLESESKISIIFQVRGNRGDNAECQIFGDRPSSPIAEELYLYLSLPNIFIVFTSDDKSHATNGWPIL